MENTKLRNQYGETIDPTQPLPVDTVEAQQVVSKSETLTYNGKAAAGAITINSTGLKAISSIEGDQVGSFWGLDKNRVYTAYSAGSTKATDFWVTSLTETAGSAAVVIYDPNKDLEEMFESVTGTVKRFVLKATDTTGATLYGWIFGVADSSDSYTIDIVDNRLTETQDWVGTLGSFDNTSIEKIEIFHYNSSLVFGTGTTLTEEVMCPVEYSKNWAKQLEYAEGLSDGQYFVDYMRGRIIGVKADATASETITYNIWSALASGGTTIASNVNLDQVGGTAITLGQKAMAASLPVVLPSDQTIGGADLDDSAFVAGTDQGQVVMGYYNAAGDAVNDLDKGAIAMTQYRHAMVRDDAYDSLTQSNKSAEVNPLSSQYVGETLIDDTLTASSSDELYFDMSGFKNFALQGEMTIDASSITVTVEATCQDDGTAAASCAYQDVTSALFGVASWVDTDFMAIADSPVPFKYVRVKWSTGAGAASDLAVYLKKMY